MWATWSRWRSSWPRRSWTPCRPPASRRWTARTSAPASRAAAEGIILRTLWGEMAYRLGGPDRGAELYEIVRASDEARVAPGSETLAAPLCRRRPVADPDR